jgi:hypothetical protein
MTRRPYDLFLFAVLALFAAGGCSAVLDVDSLNEGEPYDAAVDVAFRSFTPRVIALSPHAGSIEFRWQGRSGRPSAVDLTLGAVKTGSSSSAWMQVFSRHGRPYARIGLDVIALQPKHAYHLVYHRGKNQHVSLELRNARGVSLLDGVVVSDAAPAMLLSPTFVGRQVRVRTNTLTASR